MNGRKLSNDKQYTLLIKKLEEAKKRKSNSCRDKITGIYLEIAEYLRNGLFLVEEAEQYYNKVIAWGEDYNECALDCSLAYRNLAEMAIGKNQFDVAIEKINLSAEFAYKSNDPGIIQQALHQRAHICLSCDLPEKALEYAEVCRRYLSEYSEEIDSLRKDGDSKSRLAHLQNLIAAIYLELYNSDNFQQYNYNKKGLDVNEKCIKYAMENKDWTLAYRGLLVKLSLTVGQERLQIAELMCSMASKITPKNADERRFRRECKCHFALEKLRYCEQGNVGSGKKLLWKCYEDMQKEADDFSADLHEDVRNALFFVYKTEQREKKANSMNVKDNARRRRAQMVVFEKIGDDATKQGMNEISLHFYQKMLKCADSLEDQRKAWCSMAEAAKDCRLWERAMTFYKQVLKLEQQLGYNEAQMLETEIAIAIVSAEVDKLSAEERFHLMKRTYAKCKLAKQKRNILPDFVKFLKAHSNLCTKEELDTRCKEKTKLELYSRGEEGEDDNPQELVEEPPETDEFDEMDEGRMLWALRKEMKTLDQQEKIIKDRSNKNKHGESSLHEVARSGDYQRLKELVEKGYDVNQLDHGGWTPLSEAVTAGNMANVRLLLMSGANTNTRSTEFLVDAEENKIVPFTTSSGLSPLMEACSSGNIEIARILLQFKARASSRDDDDWTALEYLWEFLLNAKRLEAEKRELLQKFAERLKKKQMDEGFTPRTYKEFLEMVEAKKVASQRKNTSSNSLESDKRRRRESGRQRQVADIDSPTSSLSPARRSPSPLVTSSSNKRRRRTISIGDGSDEENWRDEDSGEEEEEESEEEDEETRNLDDYRKCIRGLRNRHSGGGEDTAADFSKPALLVSRKRGAGNSGAHSSAKKLFFK